MKVYYPYFRGKQFELIAIRESARLIASSGFVPIIEPVRESLSSLNRALQALTEADAQAIVVVNPCHGDHREDGESIAALLEQDYSDNDRISVGILLSSRTSTGDVHEQLSRHQGANTTLIHAGFTEVNVVASLLESRPDSVRNIFIDGPTNMLYRHHFGADTRILVRDGFERKKNADYQLVDMFSDLHVTYQDRGMIGYGDFLTIGDGYSEKGGPAYAVAIHLTFIDPTKDDAMFVYHFISDTNDTPIDPAGKFAQALRKLVARLDQGDSHLIETRAIDELRNLYNRGHFPGLGYVKKLSISHHLETLATYHSCGNNV